MPARFKVEGGDDLDRNLAAASDLMRDPAVVMPVLQDALAPVAEAARGIVPVRSGRLRSDIGVSDRAEGDLGQRGIAAYVGPSVDAYYAVDVERGRPPSVSPSGREYDATRPHPFMRPAWDQQEDAILPAVAKGLGEVLKRNLKG